MNLKKFSRWFFFFFWLGLIFYLSHQAGGESQNLSNHFILWIEKYFSIPWLSHFSFFVRKSAHFFLYFILGIITMNLFSNSHFSFFKKILFSLFFCFLYACSDEIHQLFIVGRSGKFLDVFIDTCGSFSGILIFIVSSYLLQKRRLKN